VQSTFNSWRQSFSGAKPGYFSANSKQYIFRDKETLCLLELGGKMEVIKEVSSYQFPSDHKNEWLAYRLKSGEVILKNLVTGTKEEFDSIAQYGFDQSGKWLVCQKNDNTKVLDLYNIKSGKRLQFLLADSYTIDNAGNSIVIKTIDGGLSFTSLSTPKEVLIFPAQPGQTIKKIALDGLGSQVIFSVQDENKTNSTWYYKVGMEKAVKKVSKDSREIL
jgi:hypothetical protein